MAFNSEANAAWLHSLCADIDLDRYRPTVVSALYARATGAVCLVQSFRSHQDNETRDESLKFIQGGVKTRRNESIREAALREIREEVGVTPETVEQIIGLPGEEAITVTRTARRDQRTKLLLPVGLVVPAEIMPTIPTTEPPDEPENHWAGWVPVAEAQTIVNAQPNQSRAGNTSIILQRLLAAVS